MSHDQAGEPETLARAGADRTSAPTETAKVVGASAMAPGSPPEHWARRERGPGAVSLPVVFWGARGHTLPVVPQRKRRSSAVVQCPFCGQADELAVDLGGGERQVYTEDCAVCCRPRIVHVEPGEEPGEVSVWIEREE